MPEPAHLRLERPSDGVALLTLDNPDQRNAMSDEMTASWVAAVDELAADRVAARGRGHRRGQRRSAPGGNTGWIAERAGRRRSTTCAPG